MTESKQVREKKNAQQVAEEAEIAKETKEVKETEKVKEVKETKTEKSAEKVKETEKATKAEATNNSKVEKVEKTIEKATGQDESFNWKNGTMLEKCAFICSLCTLVGAIVCLIFEFVMPAASWSFIWFDIFIGLSFLGETLTHWRFNRKIAIVTAIGGTAFLIFGILKLASVIAF